MKTVVVALGLALAVMPAARSALAAQSVPFEIVVQRGDARAQAVPHIEVARSAEELAELWQRSWIDGATMPAVDFRHDMVVAYFMGFHNVIGPWPEVRAVSRSRGALTVSVVDHLGGGGMELPSWRFIMIVVHRWPGEVALDRREQF